MKQHRNILKDQDCLSQRDFFITQILPPLGFFLYFKYRKQFPNKARKALVGALVGIPMALVGGYIINNFIL